MDRHTFCGYCGTAFPQMNNYPRICACGKITWDNPIPVSVLVQPIVDGDKTGLAIAQRAIEPRIGGWSLIGGHIENNGESAEDAAIREFREETSVLSGSGIRLIKSVSNHHGHLLIIAQASPIHYREYLKGIPCKENLALDVMWEFRELCFPIHTEAAREWFLSGD